MNNAKVVNDNRLNTPLDVKRFYLPGYKIKWECPTCKEENEVDLEIRYLNFPPLNTPFEFYCNCDECDAEIEVKLILNLELKMAE